MFGDLIKAKIAMLNFTKEEKQAVLFLIILGLAGLAASTLKRINSPFKMLVCFNQELGKVELNTADKNLLMAIPGIKDKLAQRIIEYRQKKPFEKIEELKKIKGFTGHRYEKVKEHLLVR